MRDLSVGQQDQDPQGTNLNTSFWSTLSDLSVAGSIPGREKSLSGQETRVQIPPTLSKFGEKGREG